MTFVVNVFGGGFDNPAIGLKAVGLGTAFTGIADDATAIHYNPAGLVFSDKNTWQVEMYTYLVELNYHYSETSVSDNSSEISIIPGLFISKRYEHWAFGFAYYVPYAGGGTAYSNFLGRDYDLESFVGFGAFTSVVSYGLCSKLAVGVGLSVYMGGMERKEGLVKMEYDGLAGYGGHIGFMYKPAEEWSIGFTARTNVPIEMDGEARIAGTKYDSEIEFTFPSSFTLGFGYEHDPNLMFSVSFSYRLWGHMDKMTIKTEGRPVDELPTAYKNSWWIGAGIEYRMVGDLSVRTGLVFIGGATEAKGLDPETNDVDQLTPNIGFAYNITRNMDADFNAVYINGLEEKYDSKKYDYRNLLFMIGLRFKF